MSKKALVVQFIKFSLIGVLNTGIDFAVLNLLLLTFGSGRHGGLYILFKTVSFGAAVINSYYCNKYWVFASRADSPRNITRKREGFVFFAVSVAGFVVNVSVAAEVFKIISISYPLHLTLAANLGAALGMIAVLIWNFVGYKFIVFI